MSGMNYWICVTVGRHLAKKEGRRIVETELRNIFGTDLLDLKVIAEEDPEADEHYVFVSVSEYGSHVEALKNSSVVTGVLPSYENPARVLPSEVASFEKSADKGRLIRLYEGDMVLVKTGYLSGLRGLVVGEHKTRKNYFRVLFKFCTRSFVETMSISKLEFEGSLFDTVRFPVVDYGDGARWRPVKRSNFRRRKRSGGSSCLSDT